MTFRAESAPAMIPKIQRLMSHFDQQSEVATDILGGLSNVQVLGVNNFRCYGLEDQSGYNSKVLKREKLIEWLYNNMKASYDRNITLLEGFRKHLIAEEPRCEELYEFLEESPVEFFKLLQKVALRKTFKGKCEICEDWH